MKKETNKTTVNVPRFEGVNWDAEWDPKVQLKAGGNKRSAPQRKVRTRGVKEIVVSQLRPVIANWLRMGYEVRLREMNDANPFLRVFPLMGTDCESMYASAQAMEPLSGCLAGKKATLVYRNEEYSEADDALAAMKSYRKECKTEEAESVTPDTMVKCPKCGYRFRVGRPNTAA